MSPFQNRSMEECSRPSLDNVRLLYSTSTLSKEFEATIDVTMLAFTSTNLVHEDVLAYAHLCNSAALENEMNGNFTEAQRLLDLARQIRCRELPSGHEDNWVVMNNLGNLSLSRQKDGDALHFHLICKETVEPTVPRNLRMNWINLGRAYSSLGRFSDAMDAFQRAKDLCENEPSFR